MVQLPSKPYLAPGLTLVAALLAAPASQAAGITDPAGDFLATFSGSTSSLDLDVLDATVVFNNVTNTFTLTSTQAGPVGNTASGFYVWGVNRGAGVATFAANGITGVRFDSVVRLNPNGTGSIGSTNLAPGAVVVSGNVISATFSASLLPSTGFAAGDYTWNLWPRDGAFSGFAAISDFAPNNANFTATVVPEPASLAMMLGGLAALAMLGRRRLQATAAHRG